MITLIVMTDGRRDCLAYAIDSLHRLSGPISHAVIHADGGDPDFIAHLHATYPGWHIIDTGTRCGFAGAYRSAWTYVREHVHTDYVFSTEDDFVIGADVNLNALAAVLSTRPHLAQMALLRQPWNGAEVTAGGIIQQAPDDYHDCYDGQHQWLEHRRFYTTNPHLTRTAFIRSHDWRDEPDSEGHFGLRLFAAEPETRSAFWGRRGDPPRVEHIGTQRVGTGY